MGQRLPGQSTIPFARRRPGDTIIRDGERFRRGEIDRSIREADLIFSTLTHRFGVTADFGLPVSPGDHPENTPSHIATAVLRLTGRAAIASIGCGAANEVMTWGRKAAEAAGRPLDSVSMTGISRRDYSNESMHAATIRALRSKPPLIRYLVGNAEYMPEIETDSQDAVLAFNSLLYAARPDAWLREMIRIGRPGGTVLFNSSFSQSEDGTLLMTLLDEMHDMGYGILRDNLMMPKTGPHAANPQLQVLENATDNTTLYRVDIPMT